MTEETATADLPQGAPARRRGRIQVVASPGRASASVAAALALLEINLDHVASSGTLLVVEESEFATRYLIKDIAACQEACMPERPSNGMRRHGGKDYVSPFRGKKSRR